MNGTRAIGWVTAGLVGALGACSERESPAPEQSAPAPAQAPAPATTPSSGQEPPAPAQTPREARREQGPVTQSSPAAPAAEPEAAFVVPVDMQPALTIKRTGADDIGVRALGKAKGVQYYVPQAWLLEKPDNDMRLMQMRIPGDEDSGGVSGQLVMSGGIGGSVYDNLNRWLMQISDPAYTAQIQLIDFGERDPLHITQLIMSGTLRGGTPGGPSEDTPDTTFFGAIVEGAPGGTVFVKATGPRELMEENRPIWDYFIRTLRALRVEPPANQ